MSTQPEDLNPESSPPVKATKPPRKRAPRPSKAATAAKKATASKVAASSGTTPKRGPKALSESHLEALAAGRSEGRAVKLYLEALHTHRRQRGRPVTEESLQKRLDVLEDRLASAVGPQRVKLIQERLDLRQKLQELRGSGDGPEAFEEGFVKAAASYSQRKGLSYAAWRSAGVSADVLRRAGIRRSGK